MAFLREVGYLSGEFYGVIRGIKRPMTTLYPEIIMLHVMIKHASTIKPFDLTHLIGYKLRSYKIMKR